MRPGARVFLIALALLGLVLVAGGAGYWFSRPRPPRLTLTAASFDALAGWRDDAIAAAVPAFLKSCAAFGAKADDKPIDTRPTAADFGRVGEWRPACAAAAAVPAGDDQAGRHFFEAWFRPLLAGNNGDSDGLFTGYFEISLSGSRKRGGRYQTPLYRKPADPARFSRAEIEDGALAGQNLELLWVDDPVGAFFLEIQGSGRIKLAEGGTARVGYDGANGRPYVPVGRLLVERGVLPREKVTMAAIREWMAANPKEGAALRRENPSFVFFREVIGDGPIGAERVVLTPERSLAVDRAYIPLGIPIWLDAQQRFATEIVRRLVVAQDTGGAIKGPVRGDLFWGTGDKPGATAGAMNARGRYYLLLPPAVAERAAGRH